MPWNSQTFAKHNKALNPEQSGQAAKVANAVLADSGDEGMAIAVANKQAQQAPPQKRPVRKVDAARPGERSGVAGMRSSDHKKGARVCP